MSWRSPNPSKTNLPVTSWRESQHMIPLSSQKENWRVFQKKEADSSPDSSPPQKVTNQERQLPIECSWRNYQKNQSISLQNQSWRKVQKQSNPHSISFIYSQPTSQSISESISESTFQTSLSENPSNTSQSQIQPVSMPSKFNRSFKKKTFQKKKTSKKPPIDQKWIQNSALYYLNRFIASEAHFKKVMMNKIKRADARVSEDPVEHKKWIDQAITLARELDLLNDEKIARGWFSSYLSKGFSLRLISQKLYQKGIPYPLIDGLIDERNKTQEQDLYYAAARYAQRKRLGPFGSTPIHLLTPKERSKQLNSLARRGFTYSIAQKVLNATLEEALHWIETNEFSL